MLRLLALLGKSLLGLLLIITLLSTALLIGFQQNFPGEALANYLEEQLRARTQLNVALAPLTLEWTHLGTDSVQIERPPTLSQFPLETLLQITSVQVPFAAVLQRQEVTLQGELYGGQLQIRSPLSADRVNLTVDDLLLNLVPAAATLPFGFPAGDFALQAEITNLPQLQNRQQRLPMGTVRGSVDDFRFRWKEHPLLKGFDLPDLQISKIQYDIALNQQLIELRGARFEGDVTGVITGSLRLNERTPIDSKLDLKIKVKLSEVLQDKLGALRMMLQSFQCGDEIDIQLRGTLRRLGPPQRNRCS